MEAQGPYKLNELSEDDHTVVPLMNYIWEHVVPILIPLGMNKEESPKALVYGAHASENKGGGYFSENRVIITTQSGLKYTR